jgi:O-antigen ligase
MSNEAISELVAAGAGLVGLVAFVALVTVPAAAAYERAWERVTAALLSLWVLGAFVGVGILAGAAVIYYWPRVF